MKRLAAVSIAALIFAQPALASDTINAGLLGLLALNTATGKTEVDADAGKLEAWTIAGRMLGSAAGKVWADSRLVKLNVDDPIMVLAASQSFDPSAYYTVKARAQFYTQRLGAVYQASKACPKTAAATADGETNPIVAAAGALRTDKALVGIVIEPSEAMWLNAVAGKGAAGGKTNVMLASGLVPNPDATVARDWAEMRRNANTYAQEKCVKDAALMKALLAEIAEADKEVMAAEAGKQSLLERASALESLVTRDLYLLRPAVEKAGGTLVTTKSLLTMFGYPSVRMSGGLVLTYRLEKWSAPQGGPRSLTVLSAGTIVCQRPMTTLSAINRESKALTSCQPVTDGA